MHRLLPLLFTKFTLKLATFARISKKYKKGTMAKIKLTRRTFSATVAKTMDNADGFEGMFAKALMGKTLKEYLSEQPDNQTLWVDTDKVVCVTDVTKEGITHDLVFGIMFQYQPKISDIVWIDGKDFEAFMKAWKEG